MKIRATTLLESIIALMIISIAFGVTITTYISILRANNLGLRFTIHNNVRAMAIESTTSGILIDKKMNRDSIIYYRTIERVNDLGLLRIKIKAKNTLGQTIEDYNEYVIETK